MTVTPLHRPRCSTCGVPFDTEAELADHRCEPEETVDRADLRDDIANGDRYASDHQHRLRRVQAFSPPWLIWDGERWADDDTGWHAELAKQTADDLWRERSGDEDAQWRKHASNTRRAGRVNAMIQMAATDRRLARRVADFDPDPWLLNAENGTLDLRTGELRQHDPADNITLLAGGAYRADATSPTWISFLERILGGDRDREAFLRRLAGSSAVGVVRDHVLPICWGSGANGKSTFINAISIALGDYAHSAPMSLLTGTAKPGAATPELADLRGRRLVTVTETREDGDLSVERVKALTGGDRINARRVFGQPFTFTPSHTPWLLTNHKPRVGDDGDAIWRRLLLIPFTVTVPQEEWDLDLGERLALETDGILSWIVQGALEYGQRGIDPPADVLAATTAYRDSESTFGAWVGERLTLDRDVWASNASLYASYTEWAKDNDADLLTARTIGERLAQIGCNPHRTPKSRGYRGVEVKPRTMTQ